MIRKSTLGALLIAALSTQAGAEVLTFGHADHGKPKAHGPVVQVAGCSRHAYCIPTSQWIAGYRQEVQEQVWIPAKRVQVWVPPVYEEHCGFLGIKVQVQVGGGYYTTQLQPGHMELVCRTVFVPGHWEASCQPEAPSHYGGHSKEGSDFGGYGHGKSGKPFKGYGG